ncbi:MAG: hypothetical protein IJ757_09160 [Clostridiales bacterium]|nr:hypothetical protein [Clostridiales bacterium]
MNPELTALEKRTLSYLNFRHEASEEQVQMVRKAIDEMKSVARLGFASKFFSLEECPIDLSYKSLSELFTKSGSDSVAFLISTLGQAVDNRIERLSKTDPAKMVLIDAAANAYIEEVTNEFQKRLVLKDQTFRFAPGYGDVPLSMQKQIFEHVPEVRKLGLTLDDGFLMHPFKSMTGIIGFKG